MFLVLKTGGKDSFPISYDILFFLTFKKTFSPFEVTETQTIPSKIILFEEGKVSDSYTLSIKVPESVLTIMDIAVGHIIKRLSALLKSLIE